MQVEAAGSTDLLYATAFHLFAGGIAGFVFRVRTLLMLLAVVLAEAAVLIGLHGDGAALRAVANLMGIQLGYGAGVSGRGLLDHGVQARANAGRRRLS